MNFSFPEGKSTTLLPSQKGTSRLARDFCVCSDEEVFCANNDVSAMAIVINTIRNFKTNCITTLKQSNYTEQNLSTNI